MEAAGVLTEAHGRRLRLTVGVEPSLQFGMAGDSQGRVLLISRPGPGRCHGLPRESSLHGGVQSSLLIAYYLFNLNL